MTKAFDLCVLNLMFFITSLPLITIGASINAYMRTAYSLAEERDSGVVKTYFSEFKSGFLKSTLLFLLPAFAFLLLMFDLLYWGHVRSEAQSVFLIASVVMLVIWGCWVFWLFPVAATFENKVTTNMLNAGKFALSFAPVTLLMSIAQMALLALIAVSPMLWPFVPVFAFSLMMYPQALYTNRCFKKYRADHREIYGDDDDKRAL